MQNYVGLDVSQMTTAICVVDQQGGRCWRGSCATDPSAIAALVRRHAGPDAKVGVETGSMTPWLVHGLRGAGVAVECLDARRVKAALQMRLNKTDQNDAEGLAQVVRTGWYRPVHVKVARRSPGAVPSWRTSSARGHENAAQQHDPRRAEDLRHAAGIRPGAEV